APPYPRPFPTFPTRRSSDLFGFLVPLFFIYTGVTFDLASLLASPTAIALVPLLLVALLVIRGAAAQVSVAAGTGVRERTAIGMRSEEHTSELQSRENLVCRL